jgi:hypothetical protein
VAYEHLVEKWTTEGLVILVTSHARRKKVDPVHAHERDLLQVLRPAPSPAFPNSGSLSLKRPISAEGGGEGTLSASDPTPLCRACSRGELRSFRSG